MDYFAHISRKRNFSISIFHFVETLTVPTVIFGGYSGGEDLVCRQGGEAGLSGASMEELRRAGEQEAEQNGAGGFCMSQDKCNKPKYNPKYSECIENTK